MIQYRRNSRRIAGSIVAIVAMVVAVLMGASNAANATPAETVTVNFPFTGTQETWTVPEGVTSITVIVAAASGFNYVGVTPSRNGGAGGKVTTQMPVTPGQDLLILAGEHPEVDFHTEPVTGNRPDSEYHYSGGGGSFIATDDTILVAAGGGGGASRNAAFDETVNIDGGDGGFANGSPDGVSGAPDEVAGQGATTSSPGANGAGDRPDWQKPASPEHAAVVAGVIVPGFGGASTTNTAGSGGGGYYGGGSGGLVGLLDASGTRNTGSGGGGSGYLAPGLTALETGSNTGHGYIVIQYEIVAAGNDPGPGAKPDPEPSPEPDADPEPEPAADKTEDSPAPDKEQLADTGNESGSIMVQLIVAFTLIVAGVITLLLSRRKIRTRS